MSATPPGSPSGSPTASTSALGRVSRSNSEYYNLPDPHTRAHQPHVDCPDTLACLPDSDDRPQHTLPVILRCAILGAPEKRLTIRDIYAAMEAKYPWYKTAGPTWKQSVRHHLSLNRLFEKVPRPVTDPGFGSYWTCNLDAPVGTKRPRKRGPGKRTAGTLAEDDGVMDGESTSASEPVAHRVSGRTRRRTAGATSASDPSPTKVTVLPSDAPDLHAHSQQEGSHPHSFGPGPSSLPFPPLPPINGSPYQTANASIPGYTSTNTLTAPFSHINPTMPPLSVPPSAQAVGAPPPPHDTPPPELIHRLTADLNTARWQAEALSAEVARLTQELAQAHQLVDEQRNAREQAEEELRVIKARQPS